MPEIHQQQEKAVDLLNDWSKWIIGLNATSATGCILMLVHGVSNLVKLYLVAAVCFFAATILISTFIFILLPEIIQKLPINNRSNQGQSIFDYRIFSHLTLRQLVGIQFVTFILGVACLCTWVLLK